MPEYEYIFLADPFLTADVHRFDEIVLDLEMEVNQISDIKVNLESYTNYGDDIHLTFSSEAYNNVSHTEILNVIVNSCFNNIQQEVLKGKTKKSKTMAQNNLILDLHDGEKSKIVFSAPSRDTDNNFNVSTEVNGLYADRNISHGEALQIIQFLTKHVEIKD